MSNILVIPKIGNELVLCMYGKYTVTIQTTNKFGKYTPTNLNKDEAIQLAVIKYLELKNRSRI